MLIVAGFTRKFQCRSIHTFLSRQGKKEAGQYMEKGCEVSPTKGFVCKGQVSGDSGSVIYGVDTLGFRHMLYHFASGPRRSASTKSIGKISQSRLKRTFNPLRMLRNGEKMKICTKRAHGHLVRGRRIIRNGQYGGRKSGSKERAIWRLDELVLRNFGLKKFKCNLRNHLRSFGERNCHLCDTATRVKVGVVSG